MKAYRKPFLRLKKKLKKLRLFKRIFAVVLLKIKMSANNLQR